MHINSTHILLKLTKAGELLRSSFTSITLPEIGELTSLVAFTLSTAPKLYPCVTFAPLLAIQ